MSSGISKKTKNENTPEGNNNQKDEIGQPAPDDSCFQSEDLTQQEATVKTNTPPEAGENISALFDDCVANISIEFEKAWTTERTCSIEDELQKVDISLQRQLFERLLEIDIALGFERQANLGITNYQERFPQWNDVITRVYNDISGQSIVINRGRVGTIVANFQILSILGQGGMGVVYKANDLNLRRIVALKCLMPRMNRQSDSIGIFRNEIALQGQLSGTVFVRAYSVHEDEGCLFFAMEYIDGIDLAKYYQGNNAVRQESGPLSILEAARITRQIAVGLDEIHKAGIIHRDIKPQNIMLEKDGKVRILDLGVGINQRDLFQTRKEWSNEVSEMTDTTTIFETKSSGSFGQNQVVGTMLYLSPEGYHTPDQVDHRCDLYSLGGTFLYLLTGRYPLDWYDPSTNISEVIPFRLYLKGKGIRLPQDVIAILERLLQIDREKRYENAETVCKVLDDLIQKYTPRTFYQRWNTVLWTGFFLMTICGSIFLFNHFNHKWKQNTEFQRAVVEFNEKKNSVSALSILANLDFNVFSREKKEQFFLLRGDLYSELAKDEEALRFGIADYTRFLELHPIHLETMEKRMMLYIRLGQFEKARKDIIQALKILPRYAPLWTLDAKVAILQCESELSLSDEKRKELLNEAIDILSDIQESAETLYWEARAYRQLNCDDFALDALEKSLKTDPQYWRSSLLMATVHFDDLKKEIAFSSDKESEIQKETKELEEVLKIIPAEQTDELADCNHRLAQYYFWMKEYAHAIEHYDRIVELQKETSTILWQRGKSFFLLLIKEEKSSNKQQWNNLLDQLMTLSKRKDHQVFSDEEKAELLVFSAIACLHLDNMQQRCLSYTDTALELPITLPVYHFDGQNWNIHDLRRQAWQELGNEKEVRIEAEKSFMLMQKIPVPRQSNSFIQ